MKQRRRSWLLLASAALALAVSRPAPAAPTTDPRVADLVRAGAVRVALAPTSHTTKDPATGEWRGPAVDLGRELAARLGLPLVQVEYLTPGKIVERANADEWDVTLILAIQPERAAVMEFSPPYLEDDFTYLVPAGSRIRSAADADQPGVRIAVPRGFAVDLFLTRTLKQATLVRVDTFAAALELLRTGQAEAFTVFRSALLALAPQLPGSRVLEDRFLVSSLSIAVPKGQLGRLAYVSEFIEQVKASGSVQQAITRAGFTGARVAPPADPTPGQEVLALFDRFFLAQNARDLGAVGDLLWDSPSLLWINNGVPIRGREAVRQQLAGLFQGAWQLTPKLAEFQVTMLANDVAQVYVPIDIAAGPAGQPAPSTPWLMTQVLVRSGQGWRIASILPIPAAKP
jgi:polar amino acid transport system substrate-binding protein